MDSREGPGSSARRPSDATDRAKGERQIPAVLGPYRVEAVLGRGGMGCVLAVRHRWTRRRYALKVLSAEHAADSRAVARFLAEAETLRRLRHPNIVAFHALAASASPPYYVMELLRGEELREVVGQEGPLGLARALRLATQICDALDYLHRCGFVHRDIKPGNLLLVRRRNGSEVVKLLDFGTATPSTDDARGAVLGTPSYMPPEVLSGLQADHRADIYGLGLVLYEMLTGAKAFAVYGLTDAAIKHLSLLPLRPTLQRPIPSELAKRIDAVVLACLAKQPAARPASAAAVGVLLSTLRKEAEPRARWRPSTLALGAAAAVAATAIAMVSYQFRVSPEPAGAVVSAAALEVASGSPSEAGEEP